MSVNSLFNFEELFPTYPIKEKNDLNYYPEYDFYDVNMLKKEFRLLELDVSEPKPNKGEPLKHQEFVSKFISPLTNNDRLIAFHGLGTGKTCLSVQFAELARKINKNNNKTLVLVRGQPSKRNFMRELANVCTDGDYIPMNIEIKEKGSEQKKYVKLTQEQRNKRTIKLIRKNYEIETFQKFSNDLSKISDTQISNFYSDRNIIIDEAHNLRYQPKDSKVSIYDQIHRLLHVSQRTKILLLTGTPMRDKPNEVVSLLNLLLPMEKQIKIRDFDNAIDDKNKLRDMFYGLVSYVRQMESNVKKIYEGDVSPTMKKILTSRHKMSELQNKTYNEVWTSEVEDDSDIDNSEDADDNDEDGSQSLYTKPRHVSLMVFPDGSYGKEGIDNKTWIREDAKGFWHFTNELKNFIDMKGTDEDSRLSQLEKLSTKYAFIVRELIKHKNEKAFVYCSFVRGSGILLFGAILEHFGFDQLDTSIFNPQHEELKSEDDVTLDEKSSASQEFFNVDTIKKNRNRFAVITGNSVSPYVADRIINSLYNNPKNLYGDYLRIILGSHVIGEGSSLFAVRQLHITSPHWNNAVTKQAIGRGLRAFAHDLLPPEERYIKVYRHASVFVSDKKASDKKSIDMRMYKLSEDKDIAIKKVERAMKESAVDCFLNRKRNIRLDLDKNESEDCDYQRCNYSCAFIDKDVVNENELIDDTYNMFFADREIKVIIGKIKNLFLEIDTLDLSIIFSKLEEHSNILIIRALKYCIDNMIEFISKNGFRCFLKEDNNLYYLTKRLDFPSSYINSGYANIPEIVPSINISNLIEKSSENFMETQIDIIKNTDYEDDKAKIVKIVRTILGPIEREQFLENFFIASKLRIKKNREFRKDYLEFYSNYIYEIQDKYVSFYLKPELRYIDKNIVENAKEFYKKNNFLSDDILSTLEWKVADKELTDLFNIYVREEKERLRTNIYGYYSVLTENKKEGSELGEFIFKLINTKELDKKKDKDIEKESKIIPGTVCGTGSTRGDKSSGFGKEGLHKMLFYIVSVLLKNNEDKDEFPYIQYKSSKSMTFDDIISNSIFKAQTEDVKKEIKKHSDKKWLEEVLSGIINLSLKSCSDIKDWFIYKKLFIVL